MVEEVEEKESSSADLPAGKAGAAADREKLIGKIVHYYGNINVAIIELSAPLEVGQTIHIKGANDDFTEEVQEIQFEHKAIEKGLRGQQVGVKVSQKAHENDQVFLVE